MTKPKPQVQKYRQKASTHWDTYEEAHAAFLKLPKNVRKRVRKRADGHFDVIIYEHLPLKDESEPSD